MSAPERIWANEGLEWHSFDCSDVKAGWTHPYILATPAALAASPEFAKLIAAALDRAILEAKSEIAALLGITTTRDTMTKEPVMWGDADGDCLTPEIAVQCALDKLVAEAEARGMERAAGIAKRFYEKALHRADAARKDGAADDELEATASAYGSLEHAIRRAEGEPT